MKRILSRFLLPNCLAGLVFALSAFVAQADIIYDNGEPLLPCDFPCGFIADSDFLGQNQEIADDFVLTAGQNVITDIHWWGIYDDILSSDEYIPTEPDNFTIRFYADDGGIPTDPAITTINVGDVERTDTTEQVSGRFLYKYEVFIDPLPLAAGEMFWLSVQNETDTFIQWAWVFSGLDSGNSTGRNALGDWLTERELNAALAFNLTSVPEPATIGLLVMGFAGLGFARWRRLNA